ncbi:glycosyltransferase family 1 protein [Bacillus sp. NTK074B]|uniref:glycosyltransferase family 1 protein n=1 Tax=Bacillus sp. NTK074B TaxID=2802174 RepID=UPI001A8C9DA4|nr:glycosyltransferase family 1 protein [Bacillus sp. NTK074B]
MSQPTRVLHVVWKMDRGGAETMIMNLYRNIDRTKVQFDFIVHTDQKCSYDDEIIALGGRIYNIPRFNGINIIKYQNAWKRFFDDHREYKLIHGHLGSTAAIYLYIAKKYGLYTIAHSHNTNNEITLKGKLYSLFAYPTRNIAHYFFGCSQDAGLDRFGKKVVYSSNFKVMNNAIKVEDFIFSGRMREKKRLEFDMGKKFVIGHIGRFNTQKNHTFLIDIFKKIHEKNDKAMLMMIGDGNLRDSIERKVNSLGLQESVIFTGVRPDIQDLLQAIDIFVFPSLFEGLGIVTVEAQASGLRCIVADVIPNEAYVTNLVDAISLSSPIDTWANAILKYAKGYERKNTYEEIKSNGYDICDTVNWLESFYLKKMEE